MQHIVILGGSHAGIATAHRILKGSPKSDIKITLVTPNTHHYWNVASVRAVVPDKLADDDVFRPIAPGFAQYGERFELVVGSASALDVDSQRVTVSLTSSSSDNTTATKTEVSYDYLIIATGSRSATPNSPFKAHGSTEDTKAALSTLRSQIEKASSIAIGGAGVTGVELAGELGHAYPKGSKKITLISDAKRVLPNSPESVSSLTADKLRGMGVEIVTTARVTGQPNGSVLTLSNGKTLQADLYVPTAGVVANTEWIPATLLNKRGLVIVDDYLRIKNIPKKNVWAIGDCNDVENQQVMIADKHSAHVAKNVVLEVVQGKEGVVYKPGTSVFMGWSVGPDFGTGHWGSWKLPSFLITMVRKTLFIEKFGGMVDGSAF